MATGRLTEIIKSRRQSGLGVTSSLAGGVKERLKEKFDPRRIFNQNGILTSLFPKLRAYRSGAPEKLSTGESLNQPTPSTDNLATTNREMTGEKIGLNHLNIERQDATSTGYMTSNPYLGHTQRESTNKTQMGIATSILPMGKSYDAEYNQRSFEKPLIGRSTIGNMNLFNSIINFLVKKFGWFLIAEFVKIKK